MARSPKVEKLPRQRGMSFTYWLTKSICGTFFRLGFKVRIVGVKNIPKRGAFLLVSNHVSYFDPPLISGVTPRPLYFFARKSLLKNWWFGLLHKGMNIIPVDVNGGDISAVKRAIEALKDDRPLVAFPEGTRSEDGTLQRGKAGVGMIACKAQVPMLPVRVFGTFEALGKQTTKPRWGMPLTVVIGQPLAVSDYDVGPGDKERYQKAVDRAMEAISKIEKPQAHTDSEAQWM